MKPPKVWKDERDALLFDEPPGLFDGLGRAVTVVEANQVELAAVDPALLVDQLEIGGLGPGDRAVGRSGSAVREALADLDPRGVRDAVGAFAAEATGIPEAAAMATAQRTFAGTSDAKPWLSSLILFVLVE